MELNLTNVIYLFLRLSPLIIVGFFILQSIFNSEVKGLFYLAGLLITLIMTILSSRIKMFKGSEGDDENKSLSYMCKGVTLGNGPISYLPLSQTTLWYTLIYLLTIINKYQTFSINMPTISLFGILILTDMMWSWKSGCHTMTHFIPTMIIAIVIGASWTTFLLNTGYDITFFAGVSDANVCKMNTNRFRCRLKTT